VTVTEPAPRHGEHNAPAIAMLRQLLTLQAAGVPVTWSTVVDRTVSARGLLLNTANRMRYEQLLSLLVRQDLVAARTDPTLDPDPSVALTEAGAAVLARTGGAAPITIAEPSTPATSSLYT